ncbi:uncharacterized protein LOC135475467 [Liolophura sinensis]|uniref:uncharacterized protein LOC135475467 n=1 Tax=Liolophura sinensis TaxID=3198878 RepID=UPI0031583614
MQNGPTDGSSAASNNVNKGITGLYQFSKEKQSQRPESGQSALSYDDPNRYNQPKLFDTRQVVQQTAQRKSRPLSAAIPRERGRLNMRPKSAGMQRPAEEKQVNAQEATKFWVKTTRMRPPVPRLNLEDTQPQPTSTTTFTMPREDKVTYLQNPTAGSIHCSRQSTMSDTDNKDRFTEEYQKPSITVRIRSAVKRPEYINTFARDEQKMADMEEEFRKTTLKLQKKLGIENSGLIY